MRHVLVVNAGSSSVKFQVFDVRREFHLERLVKGKVDGIGSRPRLRVDGADGARLADETHADVPDVPAAMTLAGEWLARTLSLDLLAVGHRVVHGGAAFDRPVRVTPEVLERLERTVPLAPLHQPNNLSPIRALLASRPDLPQVACFDTAFHRGHAAIADHYAIPERLHAEGVRRYGFHGLSYEFIAGRLREIAPDIAAGRVIVAHLGSGASMCALSGGCSIESTMGFSALDGVPMGTRPGQIDPGVLLWLLREKGMTAEALEAFLYGECGLKGLSGIGGDMRELEASRDPQAAFAIEHFVYRIGLHAGQLAAALGGLDAFVFTAGIGENSKSIRGRIAEKLAWLGAEIDEDANAAGGPLMSRPSSRVQLYAIPTDEELTIARHTLALIEGEDVRTERPA